MCLVGTPARFVCVWRRVGMDGDVAKLLGHYREAREEKDGGPAWERRMKL